MSQRERPRTRDNGPAFIRYSETVFEEETFSQAAVSASNLFIAAGTSVWQTCYPEPSKKADLLFGEIIFDPYHR